MGKKSEVKEESGQRREILDSRKKNEELLVKYKSKGSRQGWIVERTCLGNRLMYRNNGCVSEA